MLGRTITTVREELHYYWEQRDNRGVSVIFAYVRFESAPALGSLLARHRPCNR